MNVVLYLLRLFRPVSDTTERKFHFRSDLTISNVVLPVSNGVILENPFWRKHNITIDPENNLLHLPALTVQLTQFLSEKGSKRYPKKLPKAPLILAKIYNYRLSRKYF